MGAGEGGGLGRASTKALFGTAVPAGQQKGLFFSLPLLGMRYEHLLTGKPPPPERPPNALLLSAFTCLLMEWESALSLGLLFTTSSKRLIAAVEIYCVLALTQSQPLLGVYFSLLMHCTRSPGASEFRAHAPLCSIPDVASPFLTP